MPDDAKTGSGRAAIYQRREIVNILHLRGKSGGILWKTTPEMPTTSNNMVRVHPAHPSYSEVVPAPELLSIDVAVENKIGTKLTLRKG